MGGGPEHSLSVWGEFGPILEELVGRPLRVRFDDRRPGDQDVYTSDIRKIAGDIGWRPRTAVRDGVVRLFEWIRANQDLFRRIFS